MAGTRPLLALAAALGTGAAAPAMAADIPLVTFDGAPATSVAIMTVDDPVMGGGSTSNFTVDTARGVGIWQGQVRIVPFLGEPGFCTMRSVGSAFPDVTGTAGLGLAVVSASGLSGYSLVVGVRGITDDLGKSYTAPVVLRPGAPGVVRVPWKAFALTFRGRKVRGPSLADHLDKLTRVGLSTSGTAGTFRVEATAFAAVGATHADDWS